MQKSYRKPKIGFVLGDQAGIGPEIVLKLLQRPRLYESCRPVLIGNFPLLEQTADKIAPDFFLTPYSPEKATEIDQEQSGATGVPVVNIAGDFKHVIQGVVTTASGWITYRAIAVGYQLLEQGVIDGLVLAPINKEAIAKSECGFCSEYDILATCAGVSEVHTVVKGGKLFRASVVGHVAFRKIIQSLSEENIVHTGIMLSNMIESVSGDRPKILVAALNPCVEDGIMGSEEQEMILPAIAKLQEMKIDAQGPYPAATIFQKAMQEDCNGILYLYHDQGNIAMKAQMFQTTACIYTNIPYFILSTGHGSAMDIAGLRVANPTNIAYVVQVLTGMIQGKWQREETAGTEEGGKHGRHINGDSTAAIDELSCVTDSDCEK